MRVLFGYALQRVRLQGRRVLLRILHGFLHALPLQQPGDVIIAVTCLCHHYVCRRNDKKQRLSFHMTKLIQGEGKTGKRGGEGR